MLKVIRSFAIVLFAACSPASRESAERAEPVEGAPVIEGRYVWGAEVESFRPCGDSLTYWVAAAEPVWQQLRAEHQALTSEPYQPVFVRVHGSPSDEPRDGFALDYDGLFRIDSVVSVSATIPAACENKERPLADPGAS
jgi:hypothetical protein